MAKAGGLKGDTVATGVGRVWATDGEGNKIGGFAAEYERVYKGEAVSGEQAEADAVKQLTRSLEHELSIRGLTQDGEMTFNVTSLQITKKIRDISSGAWFCQFHIPRCVGSGIAER